ncbi:BTAD domain-containing putative transcriptional regulator [Roseibium sp.]|uniref:BTAD domain-containing putative transcriptional regulator n=1 Tax=Roseibium sp. TaxID=1936156 RepID=UPI003A96A0D3
MIDGFSLQDDQKNLLPIVNRKACGILAYLALNRNHKETRERLVGLLWSDRPEKQARASLRQCLKQLRDTFDLAHYQGFQTGHLEVTLNPDTVSTDLNRIVDELANNLVSKRLLELINIPDRILYGLETLDESFAAWLHVVRQNWNNAIVRELQRILREVSIPAETVQSAAEALLGIDPTHEEAHRCAIRYNADHGNTAAALKQYNDLWELLDREYDMEPEPETQSLIARIKAGSYAPSPDSTGIPRLTMPATAEPMPAPTDATWHPTIHVFPFLTGGISTSDNAASVVQGFRQDLIASMVRFRDWIVLEPRNVTNTLAGHDSYGHLQNRGYSITGTHYQHSGDLHMLITLKNLQTNQYVWSERLELSHDNWFSAQREFIRRMSASMSIYLTAQHVTQQIASHDIPKDAYRPWLSAYRMIWSWDPEKRAEAEVIFRDIIERYPDFAPAYSGLASICNTEQIIYPGLSPSPERLQAAIHLSRTAVALDPLDVRSHIALAWSYAMTRQFDKAINHHRIVYELNPNNPTTLISCAGGLAMCADTETATAFAEQALTMLPSINPVQWAYLTSTYFACSDYPACLQAADLSGDILPMVPGFRAVVQGLTGDSETARSAGNRFFDYISERWQGTVPCTRDTVATWFMQHCPVRDKGTLQKMKEGLVLAGLPSA